MKICNEKSAKKLKENDKKSHKLLEEKQHYIVDCMSKNARIVLNKEHAKK